MRRVVAVVLLFAFGQLGTSPAGDEGLATNQSVGDLIKQLGHKEPDKVCAAARALGKLGAKDGVPALKELLKTPNGRVRLAAAEALWRLEHKAADLVPVYAELLTATDAEVRAASAWRLGRLDGDARPAVLLLAAALRDEDFEVRVQVGQALANLGPVTTPALPALVRALGDKQLDKTQTRDRRWEGVRQSPAVSALVELSDEAIPLLITTFRARSPQGLIEEGSPETRAWEAASRAAFAFPAFGRRAVSPLLHALEAKDEDTRRYTTVALREIAQFDGLPEAAIDGLERCLDDSDKELRTVAASAMSWVRPSSTKAVTILAEARAGYAISSTELLADLERMSPDNEAARKLLIQMLGDNHAEASQEAHRVLARLELPADQTLGAWTKALSHADSKVRLEAIFALTKLGSSAKSVKSTLHERFPKENDHYCKGGILDALAAIDPDDPALVPFLIQSVDDSDRSVRLDAIRRLGHLGPKAKDAIPVMESRLLKPRGENKDAFWDDLTARDLVDAITSIAPGSDKSADPLLKALRRPDIRSMHCIKNSWFMPDVLEDGLQANLPSAVPLLREALKDEDANVRRSAALVLVRAGLETETALPILMDKLWTETDRHGEHYHFRRRVVELLSRRQPAVTPAVAAAWCKAWQTADPEAREVLERGLLVLQPEALPHLLDQLRGAKTSRMKRDLAHLLAHFEGQGQEVLPILREELREDQPASQYNAAQALILLGPDAAEAVPELVPMLGSSHPGIRAVGAKALGSVGRAAKPAVPALKAMLKEPQPKMRLVVADALSRIDPDVSEALTVLRDALANPEKQEGFFGDRIQLPEGLRDQAVFPDSVEEGIARFGERAVPVLADLLDNVDLDEWSADNVSSQCGAEARVRTALLLARLGPEAHKAVPALVRALDDKDPFIREAGASALGRIGPAAKEAAPACIALLERENRVASAGTWTSSSRGGGRSRAESRYDYGPFDFRSLGRGKALSKDIGFGYGFGNFDPYSHIRPAYPYDAPYVLSRIDGEARSAFPILGEMAKDPGHPNRLAAALAMWRSGGDGSELLPAFAAALRAHTGLAKDETVPLSRELRECLADLDTQLKPAVGVMIEWLERRQPSSAVTDQVAVLEALGRLGEDARPAADLLLPMLQADHWNASRRVAAAMTLYRIRGDRDLVFPVLREVLLGLEEHGSIYYRPDMADTARVHAARALGVLAGSGDEEARSLVAETAKGDENPHVRVTALEAMARLKQTNAAAVAGLCSVLRHEDASVRIAAASACGRLGPLAKPTEKALRVATEDGQLAVREAARQALEALK